MNVFIPKNFKYKKIRKRVRIKNNCDRKLNTLDNSICGLKILESGIISSIVFETVRRIIKKKTKKVGILKINGFPKIPLTKKPIGLRMGKGVGNIESWVFPVKKGRIFLELDNIPLKTAQIALKAASNKIGLKCKIIIGRRRGVIGNSEGS